MSYRLWRLVSNERIDVHEAVNTSLTRLLFRYEGQSDFLKVALTKVKPPTNGILLSRRGPTSRGDGSATTKLGI